MLRCRVRVCLSLLHLEEAAPSVLRTLRFVVVQGRQHARVSVDAPADLLLDFVVAWLAVGEDLVDVETVDTVVVLLEDLRQLGKLDRLLEIRIVNFLFSGLYRELVRDNLCGRNLIFVVETVGVLLRIEQHPLVVPSFHHFLLRGCGLLFLVPALHVQKVVL